MSNSNSIINALKRLERAGNELSVSNKKLREAARIVAQKIEEIAEQSGAVISLSDLRAGNYTPLIDNYVVVRVLSNDRSTLLYLVRRSAWIDGFAGYLRGDYNCWIPDAEMDDIRAFAADVAAGLLDKLAAKLEAQRAESDTLAQKLDKASK